jgi:CPA2 family monovalent cation:H+ antiporter-2
VLVARGEFSIVVAGLVVAGGGEPELQTLAAAYVLILGVVGPVLTKYSDPLVARLAPPPAAPGRSR